MPPNSPHAKPHHCWRRVRQGGICEACGWVPEKADETAYKHRGKCGKCGRQMRCRQRKMANGACKMHGGKSLPPGPDHPSAKTMQHSKLAPVKRLTDRIREAESDPHLLSLPRKAATLEARIRELMDSLEVGGSGDQWAAAVTAFVKLDSAVRGGEHDELLDGVKAVLLDGDSRSKMWAELKETISSQVRIIDSHRRSQVEAGQTILVAQHAMAMQRLVEAALQGTTAEDILRRIQQSFAQLMGVYDQPTGPAVTEGEASQT